MFHQADSANLYSITDPAATARIEASGENTAEAARSLLQEDSFGKGSSDISTRDPSSERKSEHKTEADASHAQIKRESQILAALNGSPGNAPMQIPESSNQLVVVSSDSWNAPKGYLQVFERDGAKSAWHAVSGYSWPVNLGRQGMGWGAGGLIQIPELFIDGQLERVGGPRQRADGSLDTSGHATMEGGNRATAGLFELGFAWGRALDAPAGSGISYRHIDPFYRVIPSNANKIVDEQGHILNGETIRELKLENGKYERFDRESGKFLEGTLSKETIQSILDDKQIPKYHLVNKYVRDRAGNVLTGLLVKLNESEIKTAKNGWPIFQNGMIVHYSSLNLKTGKAGPSGTLDMYGTKNVWRESDYRWSDNSSDQGRAVIGWDKNGNPQLSNEVDLLYNMPLRIVDREKGLYEKLDPDTGKGLHLGFMDKHKLQSLINNVEIMTYEGYRSAIDLRHNVNQLNNRGSAIFIHEEEGNIEQGYPVATAGCTSMSEQRLKQLMQRLNDDAMILQCPLDQLDTVVEALKQP